MMDPPILPKGIVINTTWIYDEIAKEPVVSPEALKKYWRVYTTTFQRLIDPTANRLENFWWHVWGSDRRHLPGPVLAQLFKDISTGPTFVKLRGPPNRYEPPSEPPSPTLSPVEVPSIQATSGDKQIAQESKVEMKAVEPSSSKKPPAKPILKKPRGPSSSGPRPTARFVSPPGTDTEDVGSRDSEVASSTSTTVTSGSGAPKASGGTSAKESKKKGTAGGPPKKKGPTFVASAASRRRPAMPRRQSSQSTTGGSESASKDKSRGNSPAQTSEAEPKLSAKATGKRPATQAKPEEKPSPKQSTDELADTQERRAATQSKRTIEQRPKETGDENEAEPAEKESQQAKPAEAGLTRKPSDRRDRTRPESPSPITTPFSPRRGSSEASRSRRAITLTSSSTTITSNATAQGTMTEFDGHLPTKQFREESERRRMGLHGSGSSLTGASTAATTTPTTAMAGFEPTPPSSAPAVPLGRSKSQLALLLTQQAEKKHRR